MPFKISSVFFFFFNFFFLTWVSQSYEEPEAQWGGIWGKMTFPLIGRSHSSLFPIHMCTKHCLFPPPSWNIYPLSLWPGPSSHLHHSTPRPRGSSPYQVSVFRLPLRTEAVVSSRLRGFLSAVPLSGMPELPATCVQQGTDGFWALGKRNLGLERWTSHAQCRWNPDSETHGLKSISLQTQEE